MGKFTQRVHKLAPGLVASALIFSPAHAQDAERIGKLEERVGNIETKLDAVIELLSKDTPQSAKAAQSSASSETDTSVELPVANDLQEGLTLDLYLVGDEDKLSEIPVAEGIFPSASETVSSPAGFEWGVFAGLKSMERFAGPLDKQIALNWKGKIAIPSGGNQVFDLSVSVDEKARARGCIGSLLIDDHPVVEVISKSGGSVSARTGNGQGAIALEAGYHQFSFWGHCNGDSPRFQRVHFTLLHKAPEDRAPQPIAAVRFATDG